jgi:quercetin dioxygenase-like cupin family protein
MKTLSVLALSLSILSFDLSAQDTQALTVTRHGSQPSAKGPADFFTGTVRVDGAFKAAAPGRVSGATVTFEPQARTAWHTHPLGQTLIVTAGQGLVQEWSKPIQIIKPGDTVWIPPGVKHWHGATPATGMTHVAIVELKDGKSVDWMEQVSDQDYGKAP